MSDLSPDRHPGAGRGQPRVPASLPALQQIVPQPAQAELVEVLSCSSVGLEEKSGASTSSARADVGEEESTFTRKRQVVFLEALAATGSVRAAAARAGVSHQTAYRARLASPVLARAWRAALVAARVQAEEVLATRAIDGVEEQVYYHGEVVATRRRYDSRLLLAHLARLDKLTEEAPVAAFAGDFEAALGRFAEGLETPETDLAQEPPAPAENSSPGQWSKRSRPPAAPAVEPCPECGGKCLGPVWLLTWSDCQHSGNRIARMEEARPRGAKAPGEFPGHSEYDVEQEQLAAFEDGVEEWWRVVPAGPGEDPDFWHYAD